MLKRFERACGFVWWTCVFAEEGCGEEKEGARKEARARARESEEARDREGTRVHARKRERACERARDREC